MKRDKTQEIKMVSDLKHHNIRLCSLHTFTNQNAQGHVEVNWMTQKFSRNVRDAIYALLLQSILCCGGWIKLWHYFAMFFWWECCMKQTLFAKVGAQFSNYVWNLFNPYQLSNLNVVKKWIKVYNKIIYTTITTRSNRVYVISWTKLSICKILCVKTIIKQCTSFSLSNSHSTDKMSNDTVIEIPPSVQCIALQHEKSLCYLVL